jgi:prevent-host-death family protein
MAHWPADEAGTKVSDILAACMSFGPQVVTRAGVAAAVLVPVAGWRRDDAPAASRLKELLLAPDARADLDIPARSSFAFRDPPDFN